MVLARCSLVLALAVVVTMPAAATINDDVTADGPYFHLDQYLGDLYPSYHPEITDAAAAHHRAVAEVWKYALCAHRAIAARPTLAAALAGRPESVIEGGPWHLHRALVAHGLGTAEVRRQSTDAYTLQLGAFRRPGNVRRLIYRFRDQHDPLALRAGFTDRRDRDRLVLDYGHEGMLGSGVEDDGLYPVRERGLVRVRYGVYESLAAAREDARGFERRWGLRPVVVPVRLTVGLVRAWVDGLLPGQPLPGGTGDWP